MGLDRQRLAKPGFRLIVVGTRLDGAIPHRGEPAMRVTRGSRMAERVPGNGGVNQSLEGSPGNPQHMSEVHDRQAASPVGLAPLLSHRVRLCAADAEHLRSLFHREELGQIVHRVHLAAEVNGSVEYHDRTDM